MKWRQQGDQGNGLWEAISMPTPPFQAPKGRVNDFYFSVWKYLVVLQLKCGIPGGLWYHFSCCVLVLCCWSSATECERWPRLAKGHDYVRREAMDTCLMWRRKAGGILSPQATWKAPDGHPCGVREGIKGTCHHCPPRKTTEITFSPLSCLPFLCSLLLCSPSLPTVRLQVCVPDRVWNMYSGIMTHRGSACACSSRPLQGDLTS